MNSPAHPSDAVLLAQLNAQDRAHSVVYLDDELHPSGLFQPAGNQFAVQHPFFVAFVDLQPGANWMHPCRYLIFDPATGNLTSIDSNRPPVFGPLPHTWRVIWRSPGIEDWRLLPMSPPDS